MQSTSGCFNKRLVLKGSNVLVTISPPGLLVKTPDFIHNFQTYSFIDLPNFTTSQPALPILRSQTCFQMVLLRPSCMFMTFYDQFCPSHGFGMTFYTNHRDVHVHMKYYQVYQRAENMCYLSILVQDSVSYMYIC